MTDPLFLLAVLGVGVPIIAALLGWLMGEVARLDDERNARREQHWRNIAQMQSGWVDRGPGRHPITEGFVAERWPEGTAG